MIFFHWPRAERLSADERDRRANAYPKLVEALRAAREGMRHAINPVGGDAKCAEILRIDSILRELGEE